MILSKNETSQVSTNSQFTPIETSVINLKIPILDKVKEVNKTATASPPVFGFTNSAAPEINLDGKVI